VFVGREGVDVVPPPDAEDRMAQGDLQADLGELHPVDFPDLLDAAEPEEEPSRQEERDEHREGGDEGDRLPVPLHLPEEVEDHDAERDEPGAREGRQDREEVEGREPRQDRLEEGRPHVEEGGGAEDQERDQIEGERVRVVDDPRGPEDLLGERQPLRAEGAAPDEERGGEQTRVRGGQDDHEALQGGGRRDDAGQEEEDQDPDEVEAPDRLDVLAARPRR